MIIVDRIVEYLLSVLCQLYFFIHYPYKKMVFPHTYRNEHTETITTNYTYGSWYAEHVKFKIPIKRQLLKLLKDIDGCERSYRRDLSDTVAIKCIPTNPKYSKEIYRMKSYVEGWFNKLSIRNESFDIGSIQFGDQTLVLPPVLLGRLKSPIAKITVLRFYFFHIKVFIVNKILSCVCIYT